MWAIKLFYKCTNLENITIPSGVTSIGSAFGDCESLKQVTLPDTVNNLAAYTFYNCRSLQSVNLPEGIQTIGDQTFYMCPIKNLTIPSSVTSIGTYAFYYCRGLESVTFAGNAPSIQFDAFKGVSTTCYYPAGNSTWEGKLSDYQGELTWKAYCVNDAHDFSESVVHVDYLKSEATCTEQAEYYFSCICGEVGTEAFKHGELAEHTRNENHKCTVCGHIGGQCGEAVYWEFDEETGKLTISGNGEMNNFHATGPWYEYRDAIKAIAFEGNVTNIGEGAFYGCYNVISIAMPDSVSFIGEYAFFGCSNLTSIAIPNTVTSVGNDAFSGCDNLTEIYITDIAAWCNITFEDGDFNPLAVNSKEKKLYLNGTLLTDLVIPEGVTTIPNHAFYMCKDLAKVTLPNGVMTIGDYAFFDCSLTNIMIPNSVTTIGSCAFRGCSSLTSITIFDSVTSVAIDTFTDCSIKKLIISEGSKTITSAMVMCEDTLEEVVIPNTVTSVGNDAFYGCDNLTEIYITDIAAWCNITFENHGSNPLCTNSKEKKLYLNGTLLTDLVIPEGVTTIPAQAFYMCSSITSVTIPDSIASVNYTAFDGCSVKKLIIAEGAETITSTMVVSTDTLEEVVIPNSVTSIGDSAFSGCRGLTSIMIPNSVTSIGDSAFFGCRGLTSIMIPNSVTSIGGSTFRDCSSLISITIPASVTSIGASAFRDCSSLTSITIPNSVTSIGGFAFRDCSSLISITISDSVTSINDNAFDGCSIKKLIIAEGSKTITSTMVVCKRTLEEAVIPDSVTSIGASAFRDCNSLTSITIPASVTSIGASAFRNCNSLTSITIPASVTSIGDSAFHYCSSLTSITIPDSVTSIGGYAFRNCSSLTSITIPNSVTSIDTYTFSDCSSLTSVTIPNSVTFIDDAAFYNCSNLTDIYIADVAAWCNITFNGYLSYPLYANYKEKNLYLNGKLLTNLVIPKGVTEIPVWAFYKCSSLSSVTISDSVTSIGNYAFGDCSSLKKIVFEGDAPQFKYNCFGNITATAYYARTATGWNTNTMQQYGGTITWKLYCKDDVHAFDQPVAEAKYLVSEATCTAKAVYKKSCECGEAGTETFEYGTVKAHVYDQSKAEANYLKSVATCTAKAKYYKSCVCGAAGRETFEYGAVKAHVYDQSKAEAKYLKSAATCTAKAKYYKSCVCGAAGTATFEYGSMKAHAYKDTVTQPTCNERGYTTHTCTCGHSYVDTYVAVLGHDMDEWTVVTEPAPGVAGQERSDCSRCDHFETREIQYQGNVLKLKENELKDVDTVWINGIPYPISGQGANRYMELPTEEDCWIMTYTYHVGDAKDVHTQYPTGMKVYKVSKGVMQHIPEFDNLLQYSGSSIRITGKKGIRMITSLTKSNKSALTGKGLAGYKLVEYGTMLCWASEIASGDALVMGKSFTRSNYAYKRGVADPVFATSGNLTQYTNVLVGFTNAQCKDDIAMRPYIILEDAAGKQVTLYGGTIYRSIGYIAYQNRNVFNSGTAAYKYVWDIIHSVYGTRYDKDYKG